MASREGTKTTGDPNVLNRLASVRTIDDAIGLIPHVEEELDRLDPSGKIKIALLLAIAAKIPLGEESLRRVSEGRKAITDLVHHAPQISRNLYHVLDAFLGRMDTLIDGTREVDGTLGDGLGKVREGIKKRVKGALI